MADDRRKVVEWCVSQVYPHVLHMGEVRSDSALHSLAQHHLDEWLWIAARKIWWDIGDANGSAIAGRALSTIPTARRSE